MHCGFREEVGPSTLDTGVPKGHLQVKVRRTFPVAEPWVDEAASYT